MVDPRDWTRVSSSPRYRVDFVEQPDGATEEWLLSGAADVTAVLRWVERFREDRGVEVWVESRHAEPHLVRLLREEAAVGGIPDADEGLRPA